MRGERKWKKKSAGKKHEKTTIGENLMLNNCAGGRVLNVEAVTAKL